MSKIYFFKLQTDVKEELRSLYFLLPTLKTRDVNKQNHLPKKIILSHHYGDQCSF